MVANDWKGRKMGSYSSMDKKFQLNKVNKVKKSAVQLVCIVTNTKVDHAKCFYNNKIKSKQIAVHPSIQRNTTQRCKGMKWECSQKHGRVSKAFAT